MRIVEDENLFCLSDDDIPRALNVNVLDINCPRCRFPMALPEISITQRSAKQVDEMQKRWNECMRDVVDVTRKEYGEDARLVRLIRELKVLKRKFLRPGLKVVPDREE